MMTCIRCCRLTIVAVLVTACGGAVDTAAGPRQPPAPASVASVTVSVSSSRLVAGEVMQATAQLRDAAGSALSGRVVNWSSSDPAVLSIDGTGTARAVAPGVATITATSEGRAGNAAVTVVPVPVATVQVSLGATSLVSGGTTQASATVRDAAGGMLAGRAVVWSSSNWAVATVDDAGRVSALAPGSANIAAAIDGVVGVATLTVAPAPVASVSVTSIWTTLTVGDATPLRAAALSASGAMLADRAMTWSTSNGSIATVSPAGLVTAIAPGTVTISASSEGKTGNLTLTVSPRPRVAATNVLMDLSHEFTFTYDIFTHWAPYWDAGFRRTTVHADLASAAVALDAYDIAILHQSSTLVPFGDNESQRLIDWVRRDGGRLVLIGRGMANLPLAQLAARFGITFTTTSATKPYTVRPHTVTTGVSQFETVNGAGPGTVLRAAFPCDTLVADARAEPVALACPWGAGKVVVISEPAFIANPYQQEIINVRLTKQLMAWLGPRQRTEATVPFRVLPDLTRQLSGGGRLHYTARTATSGFVDLVNAQADVIDRELQRITGLTNVFSMTFVALPCAGGGYSGGAEVGVCAFEEVGGMTLVFAHELMHSFDIPNPPPEMMHPVVSYVAAKVGDAIGGPAASTATAERVAWDAGFKRADPTGTRLDVTNDALFDRRGKMYWIIGRLEGTYPFSTAGLYDFPVAARDPAGVLRRYFQLKRTDVGYTQTPTNIVRLLSIAACRDLFPHFRAVGTTLSATPPGLGAEIAAACQ